MDRGMAAGVSALRTGYGLASLPWQPLEIIIRTLILPVERAISYSHIREAMVAGVKAISPVKTKQALLYYLHCPFIIYFLGLQ